MLKSVSVVFSCCFVVVDSGHWGGSHLFVFCVPISEVAIGHGRAFARS